MLKQQFERFFELHLRLG